MAKNIKINNNEEDTIYQDKSYIYFTVTSQYRIAVYPKVTLTIKELLKNIKDNQDIWDHKEHYLNTLAIQNIVNEDFNKQKINIIH